MTAEASETADTLCAEGVALHQAGRLEAARRCYQAALRREPAHFEALHMLGVAWLQDGRADLAAELIERAIQARPEDAAVHSNLAAVLTRLGRPEAALIACERALGLRPGFAEALSNRGDALCALARFEEAVASYDGAIALKPGFAPTHYNCGRALLAAGRPEAALASYDAAIALMPGYVEALANRGVALAALARFAEALASWDAAIALRPDLAELHSNRARALLDLGRPEAALASARRALELRPDFAGAHNNCGNALVQLQRLDEALASYEAAIALRPDDPELLGNRGIALFSARRPAEALASYEAAIALRPDYAEAHYNRSLALLALGRLEEGFAAYTWRWRVAGRSRPTLPGRLWQGEPLAGRKVLVHCEQGFGDSLQFIRYAPRLAAIAARLTVLTPAPLVRLLRSIPGLDVRSMLQHPDYDVHLPLMCLPRLFGTRLETIPADVPYLTPDPADMARWAGRLGPAGEALRVGLVWAGDARRHQPAANVIDHRRSLPLAQFAPLAGVAGVRFVSLQKGEPAKQAAAPPPGLDLLDLTDELHDFADTAALISNLDLVISVDTSVAHLAGALARPVWILSRFDGCWRWLNGREDTPWYPTARLFHQRAPGDWPEVMERVRTELARRAAAHR